MSNKFFSVATKIWTQNEKVVKLQIYEIIYERNLKNNFIVVVGVNFFNFVK